MTILKHELRQGLRTALLWALGCAAFILLGMTVYPRVKGNIGMVERMIESMGPLAQAVAMDQLIYGEVLGFYAAEAGNVLALGGGMFAAILGLNMLAKEEGRHTAEYLYPHPVSRLWVIVQKFAAILIQILVFCGINLLASLLSFRLLNESYEAAVFWRMQLGIFLLMLHVACLGFGLSAFLSRDSIGLGIGLALLMYFINLLINMEIGIEALRYLTPYYYTHASALLSAGFNRHFMRLNALISAGAVLLGTLRYITKDLRI